MYLADEQKSGILSFMIFSIKGPVLRDLFLGQRALDVWLSMKPRLCWLGRLAIRYFLSLPDRR